MLCFALPCCRPYLVISLSRVEHDPVALETAESISSVDTEAEAIRDAARDVARALFFAFRAKLHAVAAHFWAGPEPTRGWRLSACPDFESLVHEHQEEISRHFCNFTSTCLAVFSRGTHVTSWILDEFIRNVLFSDFVTATVPQDSLFVVLGSVESRNAAAGNTVLADPAHLRLRLERNFTVVLPVHELLCGGHWVLLIGVLRMDPTWHCDFYVLDSLAPKKVSESSNAFKAAVHLRQQFRLLMRARFGPGAAMPPLSWTVHACFVGARQRESGSDCGVYVVMWLRALALTLVEDVAAGTCTKPHAWERVLCGPVEDDMAGCRLLAWMELYVGTFVSPVPYFTLRGPTKDIGWGQVPNFALIPHANVAAASAATAEAGFPPISPPHASAVTTAAAVTPTTGPNQEPSPKRRRETDAVVATALPNASLSALAPSAAPSAARNETRSWDTASASPHAAHMDAAFPPTSPPRHASFLSAAVTTASAVAPTTDVGKAGVVPAPNQEPSSKRRRVTDAVVATALPNASLSALAPSTEQNETRSSDAASASHHAATMDAAFPPTAPTTDVGEAGVMFERSKRKHESSEEPESPSKRRASSVSNPASRPAAHAVTDAAFATALPGTLLSALAAPETQSRDAASTMQVMTAMDAASLHAAPTVLEMATAEAGFPPASPPHASSSSAAVITAAVVVTPRTDDVGEAGVLPTLPKRKGSSSELEPPSKQRALGLVSGAVTDAVGAIASPYALFSAPAAAPDTPPAARAALHAASHETQSQDAASMMTAVHATPTPASVSPGCLALSQAGCSALSQAVIHTFSCSSLTEVSLEPLLGMLGLSLETFESAGLFLPLMQAPAQQPHVSRPLMSRYIWLLGENPIPNLFLIPPQERERDTDDACLSCIDRWASDRNGSRVLTVLLPVESKLGSGFWHLLVFNLTRDPSATILIMDPHGSLSRPTRQDGQIRALLDYLAEKIRGVLHLRGMPLKRNKGVAVKATCWQGTPASPLDHVPPPMDASARDGLIVLMWLRTIVTVVASAQEPSAQEPCWDTELGGPCTAALSSCRALLLGDLLCAVVHDVAIKLTRSNFKFWTVPSFAAFSYMRLGSGHTQYRDETGSEGPVPTRVAAGIMDTRATQEDVHVAAKPGMDVAVPPAVAQDAVARPAEATSDVRILLICDPNAICAPPLTRTSIRINHVFIPHLLQLD